MSVPCLKCEGSGLQPRQGCDEHVHPILSRHAALCEACGGSGVTPPKDVHAANRAAAAAAES